MLNFNCLGLILLCACLSGCNDENEKFVEVVANTNISSSDDEFKLNEFKGLAEKITVQKTLLQDETIRSTPERLTYSFSVRSELLHSPNIDKSLKNLGAKLLADNTKGAKIYCLNQLDTFEIHQPLEISGIFYDMNNSEENKGIFKIVQLPDAWNLRFFSHKKGFDLCKNIMK